MSLKLKNNVISGFNINTDMSILTIGSEGDSGSEFDKENFSLVLNFKFADFAIDRTIFDSDNAREGENGLTEGAEPGYKIQCIFQSKDTFQKKFENSLFFKTSDLNFYTAESSTNLENFPQNQILNKYYKTLQDESHTNHVDITADAKNIVHNDDLDEFNQSDNFDPATFEYVHEINLVESKLLLSERYNSLRVFILDENDNIVGDSGTQIAKDSILKLASQKIVVDEMKFLKEDIIENLELTLDKRSPDGAYTIGIVNQEILSSIRSFFDISISGNVVFENEHRNIDFGFNFEVPDDFTGYVVDSNNRDVANFEKNIAESYMLHNLNDYSPDCNLKIEASITFTRNENQGRIERQDRLTWPYEKIVQMTDYIKNILDERGEAVFSNMIESLYLNPLVTSDNDGNFYLEFSGSENIRQIPSEEFKSSVFLTGFFIAQTQATTLFQDAQRRNVNSFDVTSADVNNNSITLAVIENGEESFYFSSTDSDNLSTNATVLTLSFEFNLKINNYGETFRKNILIGSSNRIETFYLQIVYNLNALISNKINFTFKNLLTLTQELNTKVNEARTYNESNERLGYAPIEEISECLFLPQEVSLSKSDLEDILTSADNTVNYLSYFGYDSVENFLSDMYIFLRPQDSVYIYKFLDAFSLVGNKYTLNNNVLQQIKYYEVDLNINYSPRPRSRFGWRSMSNREQDDFISVENLLISSDINEIRSAIKNINKNINYDFKINALTLSKDISSLLGLGLETNEDGARVLFPANVSDADYNNMVLNANNFINNITSNSQSEELFNLLFSQKESKNEDIYSFFKLFFESKDIYLVNAFSFKFNQQINQGLTKETFLDQLYSNVSVIDNNNFNTTNEAINHLTDEINSTESELIDVENLVLDRLPEKNIFRDFYDFEKVNSEILLVKNPYYIRFNNYHERSGVRQAEVKDYFIDEMTIFNEASERSVIKLDVTAIKNSLGIIGDFDVRELFIRAALFPLFTLETDIIYNVRPDDLGNNIPKSYYYKNKDRSLGGPGPYTSEDYDNVSGAIQPDQTSLTKYEGKKYVTYQRFYAKDKYKDKSQFKYSENYIPQQYIRQERNLNREYIVIDVNKNSVNILEDNDFLIDDSNKDNYSKSSNLFTPATRFMDINDTMLKHIILRLSLSFKARGGANPLYTTLYVNSIVSRSNLTNNKIFLKTKGAGNNKLNQTLVNLKHIRKDL